MSTVAFLRRRPVLIGVVHLPPLPGSPLAHRTGKQHSLARSIDFVVRDARTLQLGGCDALIVENFGDVPFYPEAVPAETIAAMSAALVAIRAAVRKLPLGVNVLRNDARAALGIAAALELDFFRVNVHTGAAVTDQGVIEGRAFETLRERARLGSRAAILADAHVKHATPLSREPLSDAVADIAHRSLADAVIISGRATGSPPDPADVEAAARAAGSVPVLLGSGLTQDNARELLAHAGGAIVGTSLKRGGDVAERVDLARVRRLAQLFRTLRA